MKRPINIPRNTQKSVPQKIVSIDIETCAQRYPHYFRNQALEYFYKKRMFTIKRINVKSEPVSVEFPKTFSLINNYEETMRAIYKVLNIRYHLYCRKLKLDFRKCLKIDLDALNFLNIVLLNLEYERNHLTYYLSVKNNHDDANLKIFTCGPFKRLGITEPTGPISKKSLKEIEEKINDEYMNFSELFSGGKPVQFNKQAIFPLYKGDFENSLIDFFNQSLKSFNLSLSFDKVRDLKAMLGEVIDNAKQHLGKEFDQFFCNAYYQKINDNLGKGQIVFLNFGQTIYEGLKYDATEDTKKIFEERLEISTNILDNEYTEENFYTLVSLQKFISKAYIANDAEKKRGTGTLTLIDTFQKLNNPTIEENTMTIISGNTQILFDNKPISKMINGKLAFNEANRLSIPPDKNYVKCTKHYFPGTLILLKFYIDDTWTNEKINQIGVKQ